MLRRDFLRLSAAAGGALGLGLVGCEGQAGSGARRPLDILILGGTNFIGPDIVDYARGRGHTLTLFNRGRTNPDLFPGIETLIGDRDGDLTALEGREWDAVIDNSGHLPRWVKDSAALLRGRVDRYLYTSSIAIYADFSRPGIDEDHALATIDDPTREDRSMKTYGPFKALSEEAVRETFSDKATLVRPGHVVGPGDPSDKWTYWPVRVARGGEMIAPGTPEDPVQFIDVRDLARFMIHLLENDTPGTFNAVGPEGPLPFGRLLEACREVSGADTTFTWIDPEFLLEQEMMFPIWGAPLLAGGAVHSPMPRRYNAYLLSNRRGREAGLTFTELADTARDTLAWWRAQPEERRSAPAAFVNPRREMEVLRAWHSRG